MMRALRGMSSRRTLLMASSSYRSATLYSALRMCLRTASAAFSVHSSASGQISEATSAKYALRGRLRRQTDAVTHTAAALDVLHQPQGAEQHALPQHRKPRARLLSHKPVSHNGNGILGFSYCKHLYQSDSRNLILILVKQPC